MEPTAVPFLVISSETLNLPATLNTNTKPCLTHYCTAYNWMSIYHVLPVGLFLLAKFSADVLSRYLSIGTLVILTCKEAKKINIYVSYLTAKQHMINSDSVELFESVGCLSVLK